MSKPKASNTDKALMEQVAKGDWAAFEVLVRQYTPSIYRFLYRFLGSSADAEDLVQETFLRAFRHADSYDPRFSLSTWLFTISRRLAINVSKSANRQRCVPLEGPADKKDKEGDKNSRDIPDTRENPEVLLYQREKKERVHKAIACLPERQRTAILLSHFEGLSYKEVAKIMGTSLSSVESVIYRAKQSLAKILIRE